MLRRCRLLHVLDGMELPTALYKPALSGEYPAAQGHWQPVLAGAPSPFRGKVVVVGDTIVGLTAAIMFAQRGWQVAVVRSLEPPVTPTHTRASLLSKRGMDVLECAGITVAQARLCGSPIKGRVENAGTLIAPVRVPEENPFSINLLSVDTTKLRDVLATQAGAYPHLAMMIDHRCVAIFDDRKEVVVQRDHDSEYMGETYDLVVAADGAQSSVRKMLNVATEVSDLTYRSLWCSAEQPKDNGHKPLDEKYVHCYDVKPEGISWISRCTIGTVQLLPLGGRKYAVHIHAPATTLMSALDYAMGMLAKEWGMVVTMEDDVESLPSPTTWCRDMFNHEATIPNVCLIGAAGRSFPNYLGQMLNLELEDVGHLVHTVDASGTAIGTPNVPFAIRQYSRERGIEGDCLYKITRRSMYYAVWKHINIILRLRTTYLDAMHILLPRSWNEFYQGSPNFMYPRSVNIMLNGRGYASFHDVDQHQLRINRWFSFSRLLV